MQTKTQQVKNLIEDGELYKALSIVKTFKIFDNSKDKQVIQTAWDAKQNGNFYKQIGKNPEELYLKGIATMKKIYTREIA